MQSLENIRQVDPEVIIKGKQPAGDKQVPLPMVSFLATTERWSKPPHDLLKLNIDGAFVSQTGVAGACIILATAW
jgi:hypothetical protein